jgi:ATP-dependent RNA helicase DDX18/HAS1
MENISSMKKKLAKRELQDTIEENSDSDIDDENMLKEDEDVKISGNVENNTNFQPKNSEEYFSDKIFSEFGLSEDILQSLNDSGYTTATEIQAKCLPAALEGRDIIGSAKTGSGKSLAFLIPAAEILQKNQDAGVKVLVLTPTRELAMQLYNVAKDLLRDNGTICSLIIGGANRKREAVKLTNGEVRLIIATPGRLLDHMTNTKGFNIDNLSLLVIDEADKILKIGFEDELREILSKVPKERQTLLFSATISPKVEDLITLSMKNYEFIGIKSEKPTVNTLEQGYISIEADKKFLFLFTFIKKNLNRKIMVFFATCKEVEFYSCLLNYVDIPVKAIHGEHKQQKRTTTFIEFCGLDKGILLCTDVAQRGLDFPDVDWVIQYDPPHDPEEYLHRVGRTARGAGKIGKALLMILPGEIGFIRYLKLYKVKDYLYKMT